MRGKRSRRQSRPRSKNATVTVPRDKLSFPQAMHTKVRYSRGINFNTNNDQVALYTFSANDLFDPDKTGTGHQPRGFDEFMAIYSQFTVKSAKISIVWSMGAYNGPVTEDATKDLDQRFPYSGNSSLRACPPVVAGVMKSTDTSLGAGTVYEQQEKERQKWCHINSQSGSKVVATSCDISDFFGRPALTGHADYVGTASTSPANQVYFHCWAGQNTTEPITSPSELRIRANIVITYDAVFTEPKPLAAS